ncbi:hypothetical protein FPV67DRAFT_1448930 [Lyophyllum atratum]|nr:hypothetical protein FPV67DRAFT_1448930 [Lyophyllum atratum]
MSPSSSSDAYPDPGKHDAPNVRYVFGFGISFVVLCVLLTGCGVVWRRRIIERRYALLMGSSDPYRDSEEEHVEFVHPVWVERLFEVKVAGVWAGIMPLSTGVVRPTYNTKAEDDNENGHENGRTGWASPTSKFAFSSHRASVSRANTPGEQNPGSALTQSGIFLDPRAQVHIAVLIAMPQNPEICRPPEYDFGVARVPFRARLG